MKFKIYCIFCVCLLRQLQWSIKKDMSRPATPRLIINGKRTTMILRGLCILYGVWLVKVCHFGAVLQHLGAAPGFCRWLCIIWLLVFFHHYVSVVTSIQSVFVRVSPYWKKKTIEPVQKKGFHYKYIANIANHQLSTIKTIFVECFGTYSIMIYWF